MDHIADILVVIFILIFLFKGYGNGILKEGCTFVGDAVILFLAYILKDSLAPFLYKNLPFFNFNGLFEGISSLNILIYELIAFVLIAVILSLIYTLILKITTLYDRIYSPESPSNILSKILGMLVGFAEGVIFSFIALFIFDQIGETRSFVENASLGPLILTETPVLSTVASPIYNTFKEVAEVCEKYENNEDRNSANLATLDILLKNNVVKYENVKELIDSNKLVITNYESVLNKYNK